MQQIVMARIVLDTSQEKDLVDDCMETSSHDAHFIKLKKQDVIPEFVIHFSYGSEFANGNDGMESAKLPQEPLFLK